MKIQIIGVNAHAYPKFCTRPGEQGISEAGDLLRASYLHKEPEYKLEAIEIHKRILKELRSMQKQNYK